MIYLKWLILAVIDLCMLPVVYVLAPVLSLFTANGWPSWGGWFWTYDNPPQGDAGYQVKRAPFCPASTPFQLYVNRVMWICRNPAYGYAKFASVKWGTGLSVNVVKSWGAGVNASDKYKMAGAYYAECVDDFGDIIAFEFYAVMPWCKTRDWRIRLGWKIQTDKFHSIGFAPLVNTCNPLDGYGDD